MSILDQSMHVVRQDAKVLELENRPIFWAICMAGIFLVFVAGGIGALADGNWGTGLITIGMMIPFYWFVFPEVVQLLQVRMDRSEGLVRVRLTTLKGRSESQFPLVNLRSAEVQTRYRSSGSSANHTVTLVFDGGAARERVPLEVYRLDPEVALEVTAAINEWLNLQRGLNDERYP